MAAPRTRKATATKRRTKAQPADVRQTQPTDADTTAVPEIPAQPPNIECEQRIIAVIQEFLPRVHPLEIAKSLAALQIDCYAVYADNAARNAEERAFHRAITNSGRGFRRMPTPKNKATRKKKR